MAILRQHTAYFTPAPPNPRPSAHCWGSKERLIDMGIFTYCIKDRPVKDRTVSEWLETLRNKTHRNWIVHEHSCDVGCLWWKKTIMRYELFVGMEFNPLEFQCINFYRDGAPGSINTVVPSELIVAYMIGHCSSLPPSPIENMKEEG